MLEKLEAFSGSAPKGIRDGMRDGRQRQSSSTSSGSLGTASYASMLAERHQRSHDRSRSYEFSSSSTTSSVRNVDTKESMGKDEYIEFLETEIFRNEKAREQQNAAYKSKLSEKLAAHEQRVKEADMFLREEQSSKSKIDAMLSLQEQRINENDKKLLKLAKLVKTTQVFSEEQGGLLKQTLEATLSDVDERIKTMESKSASLSSGSGSPPSCNQASPEVESKIQKDELATRLNEMEESLRKVMKEKLKELEEKMQKQHVKQIKALNKKWEEETRRMEERLSDEYRQRLQQLESKVATKLERVILKVNKTGGKKSKTSSSLKKVENSVKARESAAKVSEDDEAAGKGMRKGLGENNGLTKFELASSLKDITRHMLEEVLADRGQNGVAGREGSKENLLATSSAEEAYFDSLENGGLDVAAAASTKGVKSRRSDGGNATALKDYNAANQKASRRDREKRNAPVKIKVSAKQKRAREEHEKRQERLKSLYKEWTNLELESSNLFLNVN